MSATVKKLAPTLDDIIRDCMAELEQAINEMKRAVPSHRDPEKFHILKSEGIFRVQRVIVEMRRVLYGTARR